MEKEFFSFKSALVDFTLYCNPFNASLFFWPLQHIEKIALIFHMKEKNHDHRLVQQVFEITFKI